MIPALLPPSKALLLALARSAASACAAVVRPALVRGYAAVTTPIGAQTNDAGTP